MMGMWPENSAHELLAKMWQNEQPQHIARIVHNVKLEFTNANRYRVNSDIGVAMDMISRHDVRCSYLNAIHTVC